MYVQELYTFVIKISHSVIYVFHISYHIYCKVHLVTIATNVKTMEI